MKHLKRTWIGFLFALGTIFAVLGGCYLVYNFQPFFYVLGALVLLYITGYFIEKLEDSKW